MAVTNGTNGSSTPRIILYTNHGCPFAHRVHVVMKELGLPYEEVIIDLDKPREEWYLKVNPVRPLTGGVVHQSWGPVVS